MAQLDPAMFVEAGRTRETKIRRDARGRWWNDQDPITHANLVTAFDAWIERAEDGRYCLKNDINWAYVTVEGAPIDVRTVRLDGDRALLSLSDGRTETLELASLREGPDGALYCTVRSGTMPARFEAHAAMQLAEHAVETDRGVAIRIGTVTFVPPRVADPLATPAPSR
jgi:uncharacterized protein